jgi:Calcineurin-like phosphoesterase
MRAPRRTPLIAVWLAACVLTQAAGRPVAAGGRIQFVFTSDAHYGITRAAFRGGVSVPAQVVNRALVQQINAVSQARFPEDAGLRRGQAVGAVDFVVEGGDMANREEGVDAGAIQPASQSWAQFIADYGRGLTLADQHGRPAPLFVVAGNHEASNALGFYKPMTPATDTAPMIGIFNLMMAPRPLVTAATFDYARDRVLYSRTVGGVHFVFLQIWPDSAARAWMERDAAAVSPSTPIVIFTHDQPEGEAKHFRNPNPPYSINAVDRFENLLADTLQDGRTIESPTTIEQSAFAAFLRRHPNVTAYFHGNSNWNQFYEWSGPDHTRSVHAFRVDSPMKGKYSADDERRLSFQVATLDIASLQMTVRECLWNQGRGLHWGATATVSLRPALQQSDARADRHHGHARRH